VTALCHRMNPDPGAIVHDFARITRPGGVVCLMEPGVRRLHRGHDEVTHTGRRFSVGDLRRVAERAGLDVLRATGAYSFLVPPAAVLGLVERGAPKSDVGRNQSGLGGVLGSLAKLERRWLRRRNLPFGLSAIVAARKPA
jgi:SAM-dependent methyltransferase